MSFFFKNDHNGKSHIYPKVWLYSLHAYQIKHLVESLLNPFELVEFKGISLKLASTEICKNFHIILGLTLVEYYTTTRSIMYIIDII